MGSDRRVLSLSLALPFAFASGVAALLHQMVWGRRLVDVVGATNDTFSSLTGSFFLGLALGGWISTKIHRRLWLWLAGAEAFVGLSAGLLVWVVGDLAALVPQAIPSPLLRLLCSAVLLVPPAAGMGLVIPLLIRMSAGRGTILIYTINTIGGCAGAVLAIGWILPEIGTVQSGWLAGVINLVLAGLALLTRRSEPVAVQSLPAGPSLGPMYLTGCISGLLILGAETVSQMQMNQVLVNSHYSNAIVLCLILAGLAVAGGICSLLSERLFSVQTVATLAAVAAVVTACQPALFGLSFPGLEYQPYQTGAVHYLSNAIWRGIVPVLLPFVAAGMLFPVSLAMIRKAAPGRVGSLFALNGVAGWIGAEVAHSFLLPACGLWLAMWFFGFAYLLLAVYLSGFRKVKLSAGLFVAVAGAWIFAVRPEQVTREKDVQIHRAIAGPEGVVAVAQRGNDDWRILFNNSYTLGGSRAAANQERQAHLPILLHGAAKSVATLGVATGSTAAGALCHPEVESIEVIELSDWVLRFAKEYFTPFNRALLDDSRVKPIHADARWIINLANEQYDVVVGDLFLPWRTGEGRLFSREHFTAVKRSLKPRGLYCQWLPMFQLTETQFQCIARTFREVFPDAFVVRGDFYYEMPILGLVGGRPLQEIDWDSVRAAADRCRFKGMTKDPLARHAEGVAMLVVGPLPPLPDGVINTLDNAWLEWNAGANIVNGSASWFTKISLAEWLQQQHRIGKATMSRTPFAEAHNGGQFFLTLEVATQAGISTERLTPQIPRWLPASLTQDREAEWLRWPMRSRIPLPEWSEE